MTNGGISAAAARVRAPSRGNIATDLATLIPRFIAGRQQRQEQLLERAREEALLRVRERAAEAAAQQAEAAMLRGQADIRLADVRGQEAEDRQRRLESARAALEARFPEAVQDPRFEVDPEALLQEFMMRQQRRDIGAASGFEGPDLEFFAGTGRILPQAGELTATQQLGHRLRQAAGTAKALAVRSTPIPELDEETGGTKPFQLDRQARVALIEFISDALQQQYTIPDGLADAIADGAIQDVIDRETISAGRAGTAFDWLNVPSLRGVEDTPGPALSPADIARERVLRDQERRNTGIR